MSKSLMANFVCSNCGAQSSRWIGKCPQCNQWNTYQEVLIDTQPSGTIRHGSVLEPKDISIAISKDQTRLQTNYGEVDEIFGGGIVLGSVNLLAGQPGIGKSTLLLQIANAIAKQSSVLYISGEESMHQIGLRAQRMGVATNSLNLATSNSSDDIAATIASGKYRLVIVDSVQTISCQDIQSAAGSIAQITNSTHLITAAAKGSSTAIILVGHVNKEGSIAGPKVLEHAVDVVLELEGDRYGGFKVLRTVKNRYGSTNNAAIFEMADIGLKEVDNPSAALLAERQVSDGSIVLATLEGSRPILVEVQALVNTSSYGYPKRAASGFDLNRLNLLVAMLERRTRLKLSDKDVYINIVGGIRVHDQAADLAICMAIGSAAKGMQLKRDSVVFGEVGLSGEVRHVPYVDKRLAEAKKLGFKSAIGPKHSTDKKLTGFFGVLNVREALNQFLVKD